ncbi:MAG: amino-acid N-acetyltransferase [Gammaproteobacteria bacterium]|nr:amino-acid N-acetyltransferase [Gammaproteobacteria bacterium]
MGETIDSQQFVHWFRRSAPYIHAFRGRTFVIAFDGDAVADSGFAHLIHDIALLNSLGVKLVLAHGARPQIEARLRERGASIEYAAGLRVTGDDALPCVKEAVGAVRVEIESLLSMGVANSPMEGAALRVASGNFVVAQPLGIRSGVDYQHTGQVRRIDSGAIRQRLNDDAIVLLSPLGYSPTGEIFNLTVAEVATATAIALGADKLLFLAEGQGINDSDGALIRQLSPTRAQQLLCATPAIDEEACSYLEWALQACHQGVARAHLISRREEGALLQELYSRDGIGTLITAEDYEDTRHATIDDVGGILELIEPLERDGVLVRRSREKLETEIERFVVVERDGMIIACAAYYPYPEERVAELACLVVHADYRHTGYGDTLLKQIEQEAHQHGIEQLFVLTTHTLHWFQERGFRAAALDSLPLQRRALYNYQRRSKIFIKRVG